MGPPNIWKLSYLILVSASGRATLFEYSQQSNVSNLWYVTSSPEHGTYKHFMAGRLQAERIQMDARLRDRSLGSGYFWDAAPIVIPPSTTSLQMEMEVQVACMLKRKKLARSAHLLAGPNKMHDSVLDRQVLHYVADIPSSRFARFGCLICPPPSSFESGSRSLGIRKHKPAGLILFLSAPLLQVLPI